MHLVASSKQTLALVASTNNIIGVIMKQYKFSSDKDINKFIRKLINTGWTASRGKKHWKISHQNGRKVTVAGSPSDRRAILNLKKQVERIKKGKYL